jgi:[acyl-carrier-protein] S-malonyltransferase
VRKNFALIFPGQGAQAVGMGQELAANFPSAAEIFRKADEILGWPLSKICWEGPEEELTKTSVCQPALYVHGLAALAVVREKLGDFPVAGTAGLSLGDFNGMGRSVLSRFSPIWENEVLRVSWRLLRLGDVG